MFTEKVQAGSRTYFFDVKETQENVKYLVISESRRTDSGYKHDRVMVFEENLESFSAGLDKALAFLSIGRKTKSYSVEDIRKEFSRAYEKWSPEEEEQLRQKYNEGLTVADLATFFERQPRAIRSRLAKIGLAK